MRIPVRLLLSLLWDDGWRVNHKRVERIWKEEGLKVPRKQPKRGRLRFNDGSYVRLRPTHRNHVWSYDFVKDRTHDGRAYPMLTVIDEFTRECLAIRVGRQLDSTDVLDCLADLMVEREIPEHLRSDNGSEFTAKAVREWLGRLSNPIPGRGRIAFRLWTLGRPPDRQVANGLYHIATQTVTRSR